MWPIIASCVPAKCAIIVTVRGWTSSRALIVSDNSDCAMASLPDAVPLFLCRGPDGVRGGLPPLALPGVVVNVVGDVVPCVSVPGRRR